MAVLWFNFFYYGAVTKFLKKMGNHYLSFHHTDINTKKAYEKQIIIWKPNCEFIWVINFFHDVCIKLKNIDSINLRFVLSYSLYGINLHFILSIFFIRFSLDLQTTNKSNCNEELLILIRKRIESNILISWLLSLVGKRVIVCRMSRVYYG